MKTRATAEAAMNELGLSGKVTVEDFACPETGLPRRRFRTGQTVIEIDADPSDEQIVDLARNLPIAESERGAARAKLVASKSRR